MLDEAVQKDIIRTTQAFWDEQCFRPGLRNRMKRKKEKGQGLANWVEEKTVDMLEDAFDESAAFQRSIVKGKARRDRSMGDIWIESDGVFNPINVKTGVKVSGEPSKGQPNLVSLNKITDALLNRWIDSYYLLFIHFVDGRPPTAQVSLVDLFWIMEAYASFNSGPGQLMLKARDFDRPPRSIYKVKDAGEALAYLVAKREDGNYKMIEKRRRDYKKLKARAAIFHSAAPLRQAGLLLDPAC
jgi:hypothetical protein